MALIPMIAHNVGANVGQSVLEVDRTAENIVATVEKSLLPNTFNVSAHTTAQVAILIRMVMKLCHRTEGDDCYYIM